MGSEVRRGLHGRHGENRRVGAGQQTDCAGHSTTEDFCLFEQSTEIWLKEFNLQKRRLKMLKDSEIYDQRLSASSPPAWCGSDKELPVMCSMRNVSDERDC